MPGWYKLGDPLTPEWRGKPPQMLNDDIPTWWQYLDSANTPKFETLFYNVAMTAVEPGEIAGPASMREMWLYNVSKRVDVVAEFENNVHLIEVTSRAGVRALGQIMAYRWLWDYLQPRPGAVIPMIVCQYGDPDILVMAPELGITIIELTPISLQNILKEV